MAQYMRMAAATQKRRVFLRVCLGAVSPENDTFVVVGYFATDDDDRSQRRNEGGEEDVGLCKDIFFELSVGERGGRRRLVQTPDSKMCYDEGVQILF